WNEPQRVLPRGYDQEAPLPRGLDDATRVLVELQSQDEPTATYLCHQLRVRSPQFLKALEEDIGLFNDAALEFRVCEAGDDVVCQAAGEGVASECGAVVADLHLGGHALVDEHSADGEAVAEGLGGG